MPRTDFDIIDHKPIGCGQFGTVFLARRRSDGATVALKLVLHRGEGGADQVAAERHGAILQQRFEQLHGMVPEVYEFGPDGDDLFIAMEYIDGPSLEELLRTGALPAAEAVEHALWLCEFLDKAHGFSCTVEGKPYRLLHNDLKPAHLKISLTGERKVLDFGISKALEDTRELTADVARTIAYAAPERLQSERVNVHADFWSLGVMLYEMASGCLPFRGETAHAVTAAVLQQEPAPLPDAVPAPVRRAIAACLVKDPAARCQHAGEVRAMLESAGPAEDGVAPRRRGRARVAIAGLLIAIAIASAVYVWGPWRKPAGGPIESLAVLPLENLSGDKEQEYFVDGMTDALITELAQIQPLKVISRTSVMQYKGAKQPLPEIGRALSVDAIVEGTVRRSGDRVAISVQLLRAATDAHIWADTYEEDVRDVLALHRKVARAIADQVRTRLAPQDAASLPRAGRVDPQAYELYVRGRFFWNRRTGDSLRTAIGYFNQALERDPTYAPAYSGLADSHFYLGYVFGRVPPMESMPRARQAVDTALKLDPSLAEAHASAGLVSMIYDWDRPAAERSFKKAIELNRNYATAYHGYAALLATWGGRGEEAVALIRRGLEADPLSLPVNHMTGIVLSLAGRSDEAIAQFKRTLEMEPGYSMSRGYLASEYERKGMDAEAFAERQRVKERAGASPELLERYAEIYAKGGIRAYREADLKRAIDAWDGWHGRAWEISVGAARLGHADLAFEWLDRSVELRSGMVLWLPTSPEFEKFRADPRYRAALERIAMPPPWAR